METFSERLKAERRSKGFSQKDMALKLNIPYGAYKNYELLGTKNGREPPFEIVCKIADILEVSTDYLFGRIEY